MSNTDKIEKVVTLAVGPTWQPTKAGSNSDTGKRIQYGVKGPFVHAVRSVHGTVFHGPWGADEALRFAWSMGQGRPNTENGPQVIEVPAYYYCAAWGAVSPDLVHDYDPEAQVRGEVSPLCPGVAG